MHRDEEVECLERLFADHSVLKAQNPVHRNAAIANAAHIQP
jgi:hypothetical protein